MVKVIGVDFDDVIVSTNHAMSLWHNRVYGTSYQKKDVLSWDLSVIWGCSHEETNSRIQEFFDSAEHAMTASITNAVESLRFLKDKEIHIVTARQEEFRAITLLLARQHVPFLLDNFNFPNKASNKRTKAEVCLELGIEVFIDDHLDYARSIASAGIPVYLFDSPWNQTNVLPQNVERVYSWEEIVKKLL